MMCAIVEQQVIFLANETSRTKCFFLLMCLLLFFIYFPECEVFKLYFHLLSNNIKINFIPSNTPKQIFSLYCFMFTFIFLFFTCTHSAILFFIHLSFFPLPSLQWKSLLKNYCSILPYAKKNNRLFYSRACKQQLFFIIPLCFFSVNNPMLNAFSTSSFNPSTILSVK